MNRMVRWSCVVLAGCLAASLAMAQSIEPAIFVTNNVGDSITSLAVNGDGSLSFMNTFATGESPQAISLSPNGRFLAVGHGTISSTTEELRIFEVNSDATLTPRLTTLVPDSPLDALWLSDTILAVPETDTSSSTIRTYHFDDLGNALVEVDVAATGGFATSLTKSADGQRLFTNDSFGSLSSLTVDAAGQMTLIETEPISLFAVHVDLTNDGKFLYASSGISGGGNAIQAYSVDAGGMLDILPNSPFTSPGESPKVTAVTGDDRVLVAGHGSDASIWSFTRDLATGALTSTGHLFDVGSQGSLGDLTIMGDLMFVTDESTFGDGIAGVYSFRINADGSFTQLGPVVDTQGTRPEYIAAWSGLNSLVCDFDGDSDCDLADLNSMLTEGPIDAGVVTSPGVNDQYDLDGDGSITLSDLAEWLALAATENGLASPYKLGDANLDGTVNGADFLAWNANKFASSLQWDQGDFNGDGEVNGADFLAWNANKFTSSDTVSTVPEPGCGWLFTLLLLAIARSARRIV
jgi:6-phosphogluconolactonase (cycloisomerase 2 family)